MRMATVRTLGVFLIVLGLGLAARRTAALIRWDLDLALEQEAMTTAAIALLAAFLVVAGSGATRSRYWSPPTSRRAASTSRA